jgi:hypothetical protein
MKQQAELAKTMETFGPMMQQLGPIAAQAQEMIKSMKMDGDGGIASLMKMAQNIGAVAKA